MGPFVKRLGRDFEIVCFIDAERKQNYKNAHIEQTKLAVKYCLG